MMLRNSVCLSRVAHSCKSGEDLVITRKRRSYRIGYVLVDAADYSSAADFTRGLIDMEATRMSNFIWKVGIVV